MRRRTDKSHTFRRHASLSDGLVDLVTRQLTAFTRLSSLSNLDLQFVCVRQIPGGHSESSGRNLLDRGSPRITILHWFETIVSLATFPGIALTANAVHRNRQGLVCIRGDRAVAHRTGTEPLHDFSSRLHFSQRNCIAFAELQQATQMTRPSRLGVDQLRKVFVSRLIPGSSSLLNSTNRVRIPGVLLTLSTPCVESLVWQLLRDAVRILRKANMMSH